MRSNGLGLHLKPEGTTGSCGFTLDLCLLTKHTAILVVYAVYY